MADERPPRSLPYPWVVMAALAAGLLVYSQTLAFYGDEGFHLMAARLINSGRQPYLDFFYQHVPLYAYVTAAWFRIFGDGWRSAHVLSALCTVGCMVLVATFVGNRVREPRWRPAAAAALLVGLHAVVIQFGTIGQPYGLCLLLVAAAFRLAVASVNANRARWSFLAGAGLCAGGATTSSLLAAPVAPILLVWTIATAPAGARVKRCGVFLAGVALPLLPLLGLAARAPRQVFFDVVQYHLSYRRESVSAALGRDAQVLYRFWLGSSQQLILIALAAMAFFFTVRWGDGGKQRRAELSLCGWLAVGMAAYAALGSPAFIHYFILVIPFLSILATAGGYAVASRLWPSGPPTRPAMLLLGLFAVGLVGPAYHGLRSAQRWQSFEDIARLVNRVTPADSEVYADELVTFAARRLPSPGLENRFASLLHLPPEKAASLRVVPAASLRESIMVGRFATVVYFADDPDMKALDLSPLYARRERLHGFEVLWERIPKP